MEPSALNDALLEYEAKAKSGDATYLTPEFEIQCTRRGECFRGDRRTCMGNEARDYAPRFLKLFIGGAVEINSVRQESGIALKGGISS